MASPVESPAAPQTAAQSIRIYLRQLRRRLPLILALTLIATATAVFLSARSEEQYEATSTILLLDQEPVTTFINPGADQRSFDTERDINTRVGLITVQPVARAVIDELNLDTTPEELLEQVETEVDGTSNIVEIVVRDPSPTQAKAIADAFADSYAAVRKRAAQASLEEAGRAAQSQFDSLSPDQRNSPQGRQLAASVQSLAIAAAGQTGGVEVVRHADVPTEAAAPKPLKTGVIAFILSLLFATALALVLELADRRLRDDEAVEEFFRLPILGAIPRAARRSADGPPGADPGQHEGYSALATNLRFFELGPDIASVMFTSSVPGEGKTNVTLGTARALATMNVRVVAVEADMRRPTFGRYGLGASDHGLSTVLAGASPLERALIPVSARSFTPLGGTPGANEGPSFHVLPAGPIPPNPQALLSRPAMAQLLEQLRSFAEVVLIDTPPLGTVNDPVTLARLVDGIAIVVRLGTTTKDDARRTLRALGNLDTEIFGVVMTDASTSGEAYYGYGQTANSASEAAAAAPARRTPEIEAPALDR